MVMIDVCGRKRTRGRKGTRVDWEMDESCCCDEAVIG